VWLSYGPVPVMRPGTPEHKTRDREGRAGGGGQGFGLDGVVAGGGGGGEGGEGGAAHHERSGSGGSGGVSDDVGSVRSNSEKEASSYNIIGSGSGSGSSGGGSTSVSTKEKKPSRVRSARAVRTRVSGTLAELAQQLAMDRLQVEGASCLRVG
jgi:hypothetical protein